VDPPEGGRSDFAFSRASLLCDEPSTRRPFYIEACLEA
jgi:hypothetical protein